MNNKKIPNQNLRYMLLKKCVKVSALARAIDEKERNLHNVVSGKTKLTAELCKKISQYLDCTMEELTDYN